jgi:subtilisin family serine protease
LRQPHFGIRLLIATVAAAAALAFAGTAAAERYVVVYKQNETPANAAATLARAGGTVIARYDAIGVVVVEADVEAFAAAAARDSRIETVALDEVIATGQGGEASGPPEGDLPNSPAADADFFSSQQWNMRQIHAPEAHALTGGSPAVVVGLIDTGIDPGHPDLAQNIDAASSVNCVPGVVAAPAWLDDNGHGTHNAGTIAAASNGVGIVGVAPNVKIAAIKAGNSASQFTAAAVICAFEWVAARHLDVANASFNVDGLVFSYCHTDPAQQALWKAVKRAVRHALRAGATVVASAGNSNLDIAHPPFGNECVRAPSELAGVITVTGTGPTDVRASYSNYGVGFADVAAPAGDGPPPGGPVLSTWPSYLAPPPGRPPHEIDPSYPGPGATYRYMSGTSVGAAHVSGIAALVISRFGNASSPQNGKLRPNQVEALVQRTADAKPCPPDPTTCEGGQGYNSWYGHGRVNALRAVTADSGR